MSLSTHEKSAIMKKYQRVEGDTGSPEVQVAILTEAINKLTKHMQANHKDFHSRRGLLKKVSKRRKLLDYLKTKDANKYTQLINDLGIRK
jgi:small subunit ribosomal protein S15